MLNIRNDILINQDHIKPKAYKDIGMTAIKDYKRYIDGLIHSYAIKSQDGWYLYFDSLTTQEQDHLIALKIDIDREDGDTSNLFYQDNKYAKDDELTDTLIKMLKDKSKQKDYMDAIRRHVINFYKDDIEDDLSQHCLDLSKENYFA